MTYRNLRRYEKEGTRFLFNLYIPEGENGTTEIEMLMLSAKGLFVFESKNYSGWIFGSERQPKWYQTLTLEPDLPIDPLPEKSVPAAAHP